MQLLQTKTPSGTRHFVDGTRVSKDVVDRLKATHDQDTFQTKVDGDVVRQYSSLRKRAN